MIRLLAYNIFLVVCLLFFYNLAGFDQTELLFLGGLLLVSQASHLFFLPAVLRLGLAYGLLETLAFALVIVCAFNPNWLNFWLMWSLVLGLKVVVGVALVQLSYFPTEAQLSFKHLSAEKLASLKQEHLRQAEQALQYAQYRWFFAYIEPHTPPHLLFNLAELKQKFIQEKRSVYFNQECSVFLSSVKSNG